MRAELFWRQILRDLVLPSVAAVLLRAWLRRTPFVVAWCLLGAAFLAFQLRAYGQTPAPRDASLIEVLPAWLVMVAGVGLTADWMHERPLGPGALARIRRWAAALAATTFMAYGFLVGGLVIGMVAASIFNVVRWVVVRLVA